MTIDDVRAAAEQAQKWDPLEDSDHCPRDAAGNWLAGNRCRANDWSKECVTCLCAKRAVEDIASAIRLTLNTVGVFEQSTRETGRDSYGPMAVGNAEAAARIASYFASEPNTVSEFREKVRAFVEGVK